MRFLGLNLTGNAKLTRRGCTDEAKSHPRGWPTNLFECNAIGETAIVTDALGVRDHVRDGETGAVRKVLDPANKTAIDIMCKLACQTVLEQYNYQNHATRLLAVLDEAVQENSRS